jgi:probable rRNA maturation factor
VQLKITPNLNFAECVDEGAPWLRFLAGLAGEIGPAAPCVEVNFIDDARMRDLNREYRGKDAATDVLSYSYGASAAGEAEPGEDPEGEILISMDMARRQAAEAGHDVREEVSVLVIHGLYHILGMDHEDDDEADAMESAEEPFRRRIARHFREHPERS